MDLCIDVGNTTFVIGIYDNDNLIIKDFFLVDDKLDKKQYENNFLSMLDKNHIKPSNVTRIIYSSVVPDIDNKLLDKISEIFSCPSKRVKKQKNDLSFGKIDINEVGDDLIAVLVGAKKKYGYPSIIIDLGTASKVLLLDKNGVFDTCLIIPGLSMSIKSLSNKAALLPDINLSIPSSILAHNTIEAMNAGVILGHVEMIKGLTKRIEEEIGYSCHKLLTGGASIYLNNLLDEFIYDENLCLDGLKTLLGGDTND